MLVAFDLFICCLRYRFLTVASMKTRQGDIIKAALCKRELNWLFEGRIGSWLVEYIDEEKNLYGRFIG